MQGNVVNLTKGRTMGDFFLKLCIAAIASDLGFGDEETTLFKRVSNFNLILIHFGNKLGMKWILNLTT